MITLMDALKRGLYEHGSNRKVGSRVSYSCRIRCGSVCVYALGTDRGEQGARCPYWGPERGVSARFAEHVRER